MEVGDYTYGADKINLKKFGPVTGPYEWSDSKLIIGKFCSIGLGCNVYLNENHRHDWVSTYPFGATRSSMRSFKKINKSLANSGIMSKGRGNVVIGNDVWLGENVTIMSGVTIGNGAVLATNAHVVKDVAPYSIVGGNPAKHLKYRFSEEQINQLLQIQWWDWPIEKIDNHVSFIQSDNIDEFIKKALEN
jgi:virginiamycin A acetyltransferase